MRRHLFASLTTSFVLAAAGCGESADEPAPDATTTVRVTLENVSDDQTHTLSDGSALTIALAPGLYAISDDGATLYGVGEQASAGLERLAELGDPMGLAGEVSAEVLDHGIIGDVNNPNYEESPILPGQVANFVVEVEDGQLLEVAMMLGVSNDTILGAPGGVDLLAALGDADSADATALFTWVDVGTEVDEPLGEGAHQPSADPSIDAGDAEGATVQPVSADALAAEGLPALSQVVKVTLTRL
jgi:hypothetical protein